MSTPLAGRTALVTGGARGIGAAIVRRLRGDKSPITLDVSMIDCALALMSGPTANTIATGKAPDRVGNRGFVGSPGAETFATADGYISVAANTMGQFRTLCRELGRPGLASPPHVPDGLGDGAFLANAATDELRAELAGAFEKMDSEALETALNDNGVPASKVRDLGDYLTRLYPRTPGIGVDGEPVALGPAFRWGDLGAPSLPPAPKLGADTDLLNSGAALASPRRANAT